jgi:TrmH family RNA methyltransferase
MTITSPHNDRLKEIRKLAARRRDRERAGRFVAEGEDLLAAADAAGWAALDRLCAAGSGLPGDEVAGELLGAVSGLGSGTRTVAVYAERWAPAPLGPLCVYLHGVRDPGNVGTVLRGAAAFGAASVALGPACADPFSPKAVRASMGAVFSVPVARAGADVAGLPGVTIALKAGAGPTLAEAWRLVCATRIQRPAATLVVGSERDGLPEEIEASADHVAHIPIATESLNAAMAATVALYEVTRAPDPESVAPMPRMAPA